MVIVAELQSGIFIFMCGKEDSNRILNLSPWSFDSRPLVLKPWSPDENYELQSVNVLPIWERFPGLNLHMRSEKILSMIASTVSKPLRTNGFPTTNEKLSYARVLIEVYASNELKREVCIKGPRGTNYYQRFTMNGYPREGDSSSVLEISESIEESKDSIESEEPFIEVKRKMKKKEKRKEKKRRKGRETEIPVDLSKWNNRRSKVKGALFTSSI
ncbi:hypothetical protein QQ045_002018 [Rhodiola kirilowii]